MPNSATDRILVEYLPSQGIVGQRLLDPKTGTLYHLHDTERKANHGFQKQPGGLWENEYGSVVREVYEPPKPESAPKLCVFPACNCMRPCSKYSDTVMPPTQQPTRYPDGNPKSIQGAKKYSLRYIPLPALVAVGRAMEDGANKYGPANWRESGVAASVYIDAALRHIFQYFDGKQNDAEDSRVHNLGHAMACLAIIIDAEYNGSLIDDRPFPCKDTDELLRRAK